MNNVKLDFNDVSAEAFFKDLDLVPHNDLSGKVGYYVTDCPACGEHEAYIYTAESATGTPNVLRCNRLNKCGHTITGFEHYKNVQGITSNKEAIELLCKDMGIEVDQTEDVSKKIENTAKCAVLDVLSGYFHDQLFNNPDAKQYLDYFCNERKYDQAVIKKTDLGFYPGYDKTVTFLKSRNLDHTILDRVGLNNHVFGKDYHLFLPYKNIYGGVTGFLSRYYMVDPPKDVCDRLGRKDARWYSTTGLTKESLYNLYKFKNAETLIVVEGYLDALYLSEFGLSVVAVGQGSLSRSHVQALKATKVKKVILCFDNEVPADDRAEVAIKMLLAQTGLEVFKCSLSDTKDPDEFYRKHGIDALRLEFSQSEISSSWLAKRAISKHDIGTDLGKSSALDALIDLSGGINDKVAIDNIYSIAEARLSVSKDAFIERISKLEEQRRKEKVLQTCQTVYTDLGKLLQENDVDKIGVFLRDAPKKIIESSYKSSDNDDIRPFDVDAVINEMRATPEEHLNTGIEVLDEKVSIRPSTLTVLAGRPRMGKTSVALNLLPNMLKNDLESPVIFFSLEMTQQQIFVRLNSIIANKYDHKEIMEFYKKGEYPAPIQEAQNLFRTTFKNRLYIISDPSMDVDKLVNTVYRVYEKHGKIGPVFLDYLQLVKSTKQDISRYLQVGEVCKRLVQLASDLNIPVIALAALNRDVDKQGFNKGASSDDLRPKLHHLSESGQIEADAALIIGLHERSAYDYTEFGSDAEPHVTLELIVLKNRFGQQSDIIEVRFNKKTGRLLNSEDIINVPTTSAFDNMIL